MTTLKSFLLTCTTMFISLSTQAQILPTHEVTFSQPVELQLLQDSRGGSALTRNDVLLNGVTTGNTVNAEQISTGTNNIAGGSFANMTGMPIVIQNSGANVLIQNSTVLNLRMN